jgi:Uncharacterized protein conserved in bacteria, putative lipoprotein
MNIKCITIVLMLFSIKTFGYDLCESKKPTSAEYMICSNSDLKLLDVKLNEVYSMASNLVKEDLKKDQLNWLRNYRNKCQSTECMSKLYEERIELLIKKNELAKKVYEVALSKNESKSICGEIASLATTGEIHSYKIIGLDWVVTKNNKNSEWNATEQESASAEKKGLLGGGDKVYNIKISNRNELKKFITYQDGGSCYSSKIYNSDYIFKQNDDSGGRVDVNDPEGDIDWAGRGEDEFPIYYKGRNYIVTGAETKPELISLIRSDGMILPLCLLESTNMNLTVKSNKNNPLCSAVASGKIQPEKWHDADSLIHIDRNNNYRDEYIKKYGEYSEHVETLSIPMKNGQQETIAKMEYNSGGGCGSHDEWLRKAKTDSDPLVLYPKSKDFENAKGEEIKFYLANGKYHIGIFSYKKSLGLFKWEDDKMVQECEFGQSHTFDINKVFDSQE